MTNTFVKDAAMIAAGLIYLAISFNMMVAEFAGLFALA